MERIALSDGGWFDRDAAAYHFEEGSRFDGSNYISMATGSQWNHEELFVTRNARFVLYKSSQWQGTLDTYQEIDAKTAGAWLVRNGHEIPEDLPGLKRVMDALAESEV